MDKRKNRDRKLLSVIIPMYNSQETIQKCLDSLLLGEEQMRLLEVVVVDDGSEDRGAEYAKAYRIKYPDSFRIVKKQNGGHGSAVNAGVSCCRGKYFKVLDADDWVNTDSLSRLLQQLKETDAQVIVCGYDRYQVQTKKLVPVSFPHGGQGKPGLHGAGCGLEKIELDMGQLIREWGRYRQLFCLHGMIYHTGFYKSLRYRQPEHVSYDDAFFFTVPCSHADRICILDLQLYVYRTGEASQSVSRKNREMRIHQLEAVIRAIVQTKNRSGEKTEAGREYWYRKLVSVVTDYYVTAFLRFQNRRQGRKTASRFTRNLARMDRELYRRIRARYWLLWAMSLCGRGGKDFERLLEIRNCSNALDFGKRTTGRRLYLKTLVKSILQQVFLVPAAALYYQCRLRRKGVYNLVICDHIGDFLYTMGYARAFCRKNHIKKLRIVSTARFRELAGLYPAKGWEYRAVSGQWLHLLCIANRYASGRQLFGRWNDCCIVEPAAGFVGGFAFASQFPGLNLKNCIFYGSLNLSEGSRFEAPGQAAKRQAGKAGVSEHGKGQRAGRKGKILLCPFAQAMHYDRAQELFGQLAERFKAENYEVYVNAARGESLQIDAEWIHCGFMELYQKFGQYEAVIGIRSGILDLAAFSGCRVTALYPPAYDLAAFYDLRHTNGQKQDLYQYELTGDMERDIQAIMQINEEGKRNGSAIHYRTGGRKRDADETADP